ncbi:Thiamine-monophosphate kinase [Methylophaga frappieri]|uniref:Thiamine-monophosphate kinase n=1 Tax=Methylophaga frappieri (strain ATCC BAA-2434 / DSM 25690 / JAM7) TaxID=754477 RepID=I1YGM6_METFJ|nr:thiamine-phosphate kinase [Methylophaga frappieri]AFJ02069.1 Thiamine-monophosphate kinase [Methylophaga frappieri]
MAEQAEFSLIDKYFAELTQQRADIALGIGDDCALIKPQPATCLATSVDTLVSGVHFFPDVSPFRLGRKALAVNLSDLAAMGAQPAFFTLALSLPKIDEAWLAEFAAGLADLALEQKVQLVGGDTTRGPLSITIQASGYVSEASAFRRAAAQVGDLILVSGTLGDAGAGLAIRQQTLDTSLISEADQAYLLDRLERPQPRNALALALRGSVHAAIDISDGLLADLRHILTASHLGAELDLAALPLSSALKQLSDDMTLSLALTAGDDYELCLTMSETAFSDLPADIAQQLTPIGRICQTPGIHFLGKQLPVNLNREGYDHFQV